MTKDRQLSVRMIAEETGLDENAAHRIIIDHLENLCKISAEKLLCGAKSEPVGNFLGFAGKNRN